MSELIDEQADVAAEDDAGLPDAHPGVEDGFVDSAGDKIVHEYDDAGNLIGWHKEPADGGEDGEG